jgi:hypothetical protein
MVLFPCAMFTLDYEVLIINSDAIVFAAPRLPSFGLSLQGLQLSPCLPPLVIGLS